jgi:hypothetical protein
MREKWGFFLNGTLGALDAPGKWFADSAAGKVYLWAPDGDSPAAHSVEASVFTNGFEAAGRAHLVVEHLRFAGHYRAGVSLEAIDHGRVSDCIVADSGWRGIGSRETMRARRAMS